MQKPDHRHRRLLRVRRERPRGRAAECIQQFPPSDVACHVTLRLGVIHAMEELYHLSIARSVTTSRQGSQNYFALMLAARITLPHFSVSSAMSLPNSASVIGIGSTPTSASRAFSFVSAR